MSELKPLVIDKRDLVKGLHTYCSKCNRLTTTRKCGNTGKRISSCKSPEYHLFKVIKEVPNSPTRKKKTKLINTRDISIAIKEKTHFENELIANNYQDIDITPNTIEKPSFLIECMAIYIGYLNDVGIEKHKIKNRTRGHVAGVERSFKYFALALKSNRIDHTILRIEEINDKVVGFFHTYLIEKKRFANATYNKHIATLRQFYNWLIEKRKYDISNPFIGVNRLYESFSKEIIEPREFKKLLNTVKPENGIKTFTNGHKKNMYRPWLKIAFRIALETGLRREEFMTLTFQNIVSDKSGKPQFIKVENFKVNRSKGNFADEGQFKLIPITRGMNLILKEIDYSENRDSERFLISPNDPNSRNTLINKVSKSFTHFWELAGQDKKIQLKNLRKTYLTALTNHFGDRANLISDHADMKVLMKHYVNDKKVMEQAKSFSVF